MLWRFPKIATIDKVITRVVRKQMIFENSMPLLLLLPRQVLKALDSNQIYLPSHLIQGDSADSKAPKHTAHCQRQVNCSTELSPRRSRQVGARPCCRAKNLANRQASERA